MGAIALLLHYLHDVMNLTKLMGINWERNSSWRAVRFTKSKKSATERLQIRILWGKTPDVPYSEQCMYNLYARAFSKANFASKVKAHLPRHILGYRQEELGYVL